MTTVDYAAAYPFGLARRNRLQRAARYSLVLAVWLGLFLVRPRLALQILHERREDSPLRRRAGRQRAEGALDSAGCGQPFSCA